MPVRMQAEVPKPDGSIRMCVDYRELNENTVKDTYTLPNTATIMEALHGMKVFSAIDMSAMYHQFRLDGQDEDKTAIKTVF